MGGRGWVWALMVMLAVAVAAAAEEGSRVASGVPGVTWRAEIKLNYRDSKYLEWKLRFPFPPEVFPPGRDGVYLATPDAGRSLELSNVALSVDAILTPGVRGRMKVHVLDLYDRNPTSSDDRVHVREAWLLFGGEGAEAPWRGGSSWYLLAGKAPRFTKQLDRRLESYGLWGTAVGRFEQVQVQLGGRLGSNLYLRAHLANPNPLFMRDPDALAGDNGTPERSPAEVDPIYESGFPILYEAKAGDVNAIGTWEKGAGLGLRFGDERGRGALDLLLWGFRRELAERVRIRGSYYEGDLELLRGAGIPLPISGKKKEEIGANLRLRLGGLRVFAQGVAQEIAGLERSGVEVETAWRIPLPGLFAVGDQPAFTWVQPAVRYSKIDNDFVGPAEFVAPSFFWDWEKLDVGVRVGVLRGVDFTAEYARHTATTPRRGVVRPREFLATLRVTY